MPEEIVNLSLGSSGYANISICLLRLNQIDIFLRIGLGLDEHNEFQHS